MQTDLIACLARYNAVDPVAQLLLTLMIGTPVNPIWEHHTAS